MVQSFAPSMRAASSSDAGTALNAVRMMMRLIVVIAPGTMSAQGVSCMWRVWPTSRYVGMSPPPKNIVKTMKNMIGFLKRRSRRDSA